MVQKRVGIKKERSLEELIKNPHKSPLSSYNKPTKIETKNNDFKLGFANTIYAGSITDKKLFRNFLRYAQSENLDAVLIPGNTIWLDTIGYSKNKPNRSELVEMALSEELKDKDMVYLTTKEKLDLVIKHSLKPLFYENNKPIYKGPVYVTFGEMEENLCLKLTQDYEKIKTNETKEEIGEKILELKTQKKEIEKELKSYLKEAEKEERDEEATVVENFNKKLDNLSQEIIELKKGKSRIILSDGGAINNIKIRSGVEDYLVQQIENAIPNSKVVSTGNGVFEIGDKTIKLKHNTGSLNTLMDNLVEKTRVNLPLGENPDLIVAGGLSATYTQAPVSYVNKKGKDKSITLVQLPTCLDEKNLKQILAARVRFSGSNIAKLIKRNDFNSGALVIEYIDGIQKRKLLTSDYLNNDKMFSDKVKESKIMYEANVSDQHHGSKYETLIETRENYEYAFTVSMDLLDKINAPILRFLSLGDETQGKNYDTDQEGHKQHLLPSESKTLEEKILKQFGQDPTRLSIELRKLRKLQEVRSGILIPQDQTHDFLNILNYELLKKVVNNAREAKFVGPIIYFIAGNHDQHTYDGMVKTTKDMAYVARLKLGATEKEVCAPILGLGGVYTGSFGIKGDYKYAEYARHKQGSSRNSKAPAKKTKSSFLKRGLDDPEFSDAYIVNRSGHNHLGGQDTSKKTFHDICYCYMDRNYYGEKLDYGSPARGFKVLGFPKDGPSTGPIVTIEFPLSYLQKWAIEKPKINTQKLFKNSVI